MEKIDRTILDMLLLIKPKHINKKRLIRYLEDYMPVDMTMLDILYAHGIISRKDYKKLVKFSIEVKRIQLDHDEERLELIDKDFKRYCEYYNVYRIRK